MNSIFCRAIYSLLLVLVPTVLSAQIEIDETDTNDSGISTEYWDKHMKVRMGTATASSLSSDDYRYYSFVNFRWEHDFDWIVFNFEAEAYRRDYRYVIKLDSDRKSSIENEIRDLNNRLTRTPVENMRLSSLQNQLEGLGRKELKFNLGENRILFPDANVKFKISDYVEVSGGYHTVVWGQVNGFSPIDYVLPLRSSGGGLSINKSNSRLPQLAGIVSIFPIPQIEIQGYYFPDLTLDASYRNAFESFAQEDLDLLDGRQDYIENKIKFPKKSKEAQYAGRVLFYFDWATLGFTYYENYSQFFYTKNTKIERVGNYYRYTESPTLVRIQNYGFESAFPIGNWIFKIDGLRRDIPAETDLDKYSLSAHNDLLIDPSRATGSFGSFSSVAQNIRTKYINYVVNKNKGSFGYATTETIIATELSKDSENWNLGFGLAALLMSDDSTGKELKKLKKEVDIAEGTTKEEEPLAGPIPFINITNYLSEDKKDIIGFSAGFLGGIAAGATVYWGSEFFESFQVGVALEYLQLFSSNEVEDLLDGYKIKNAGFPSLRLILGYTF